MWMYEESVAETKPCRKMKNSCDKKDDIGDIVVVVDIDDDDDVVVVVDDDADDAAAAAADDDDIKTGNIWCMRPAN